MIEGQHASNRARARVIPQRLDKRWHASGFDKRIIIQQQKQIAACYTQADVDAAGESQICWQSHETHRGPGMP
jgi:hypothetical protein